MNVRKAAALFLCAFLVACATSTSNVGIGEFVPAPQGEYAFVNSVVINNQALSRRLRIVDIKGRMADDLMEAQVQVMNLFDTDYHFEYRFQWYDSKGFEIDPDKGRWTPSLIYGQEVKTLVGIASNPAARKFRINIRDAHPVR